MTDFCNDAVTATKILLEQPPAQIQKAEPVEPLTGVPLAIAQAAPFMAQMAEYGRWRAQAVNKYLEQQEPETLNLFNQNAAKYKALSLAAEDRTATFDARLKAIDDRGELAVKISEHQIAATRRMIAHCTRTGQYNVFDVK